MNVTEYAYQNQFLRIRKLENKLENKNPIEEQCTAPALHVACDVHLICSTTIRYHSIALRREKRRQGRYKVKIRLCQEQCKI